MPARNMASHRRRNRWPVSPQPGGGRCRPQRRRRPGPGQAGRGRSPRCCAPSTPRWLDRGQLRLAGQRARGQTGGGQAIRGGARLCASSYAPFGRRPGRRAAPPPNGHQAEQGSAAPCLPGAHRRALPQRRRRCSWTSSTTTIRASAWSTKVIAATAPATGATAASSKRIRRITGAAAGQRHRCPAIAGNDDADHAAAAPRPDGDADASHAGQQGHAQLGRAAAQALALARDWVGPACGRSHPRCAPGRCWSRPTSPPKAGAASAQGVGIRQDQNFLWRDAGGAAHRCHPRRHAERAAADSPAELREGWIRDGAGEARKSWRRAHECRPRRVQHAQRQPRSGHRCSAASLGATRVTGRISMLAVHEDWRARLRRQRERRVVLGRYRRRLALAGRLADTPGAAAIDRPRTASPAARSRCASAAAAIP